MITTSTTSSAARRVLSLMVVSVCCVPGVSTFAQSNTDRERDPLRSSRSAARIYVASRECDDAVTADNLHISATYTQLVAEMLSRSPTFRRQYSRLARAPFLSVVLRSDMPPGRRVPALTQLLFRDGGTEALVHVTPSARSSEFIAHELEHIIEQLDGVNLRAKARLRSSGVRLTADDNTYETTRAVLAGQRVAREMLARAH